MELISPNPGTIFWLIIIFGMVVLLLRRFAWKPILTALKERELSISEALKSAATARMRLQELQSEGDAIRALAIREKEQILRDAREIKEKIIAEARDRASQESQVILQQMREQLENEKTAALNEVREQIAGISVQIAEKILQQQLETTPRQESLIRNQLDAFKLN